MTALRISAYLQLKIKMSSRIISLGKVLPCFAKYKSHELSLQMVDESQNISERGDLCV